MGLNGIRKIHTRGYFGVEYFSGAILRLPFRIHSGCF